MILFHFLYDLREFFGFAVAYNQGIFYYTGKVSGSLFILISAISSGLSANNLLRAVKILGLALLITIVTHLYDPDFGIKFGILHFLGLSILLQSFFRWMKPVILIILGTFLILLGNYLGNQLASSNYLFLFNLTDSSWLSADYYPLLPWFGVFLYGTALGRILYPGRKSLFPKAEAVWRSTAVRAVSWLGRHTLWVYLIHQPLLILLISLYIKFI